MKDTASDDSQKPIRAEDGFYTAPAICQNCFWRGMVTQERGLSVGRDIECPNCGVEYLIGRSPHYGSHPVMKLNPIHSTTMKVRR